MDATLYRTLVFTVTADKDILNDAAILGTCVDTLISTGRFSRLGNLTHQFEPNGITMLTLLSESHIALHTWPDQSVGKIVVSTCQHDPVEAQVLADVIQRELSASNVTYSGLSS